MVLMTADRRPQAIIGGLRSAVCGQALRPPRYSVHSTLAATDRYGRHGSARASQVLPSSRPASPSRERDRPAVEVPKAGWADRAASASDSGGADPSPPTPGEKTARTVRSVLIVTWQDNGLSVTPSSQPVQATGPPLDGLALMVSTISALMSFEQVPLVGLSPEAEPGPKELARLVDEVRATGATTVFAETLGSSALADTVARESGAVTGTLDPLEGLTPAEVDAGADYFSVMRENLASLRKALGCT